MTIQSGTLGLGAKAVACSRRRFIWDSDGVVADAQFFLRVFFFSPVIKPVTASEKYPEAPA